MLKKIFSTFITKILTGIISLLIAVLVSNWLGAEGKGIQGLYFTTIGLSITLISILGLMPVTYLYRRKPSLNYFLIVYLWSFISIPLLYFSLKHTSFIDREYILYATITCFCSSLVSNNLSIFIIKEKLTYFNLALVSQPISKILFILLFYYFKQTFTIDDYIHSLLYSFLVLLLFSLKGLVIIFKEQIRLKFNSLIKDLTDMFRYGFLHQITTILQLLSFRVTYYILNHYSDVSNLGVYTNAISISESVWIISKSLSVVFYSRMLNTKSNQHKELFQAFTFASFWIQALALAVLVFIPSTFYTYLFGSDFYNLKKLLVLLLPASLLFGQSFIFEFYFAATGKHHINVIANLTGMMIILGFAYLFVPTLSAAGAALATNIGCIATILIYNHFLVKNFKYSILKHLFSITEFLLYYQNLSGRLSTLTTKFNINKRES